MFGKRFVKTIKEIKMATNLSREKAAQAWCTKKTSNKIMDTDLAEAFADILDEVWNKPWLGNATNEELINELKTRIEINWDLNYRTTES